MTCSNCGTELKDGDKFCLKCGSPVSVPVVETEKDAPVTEEMIKAMWQRGTENNSRTHSVQEALSDMDVLEEKLSKLHDLFTKELIDSDEYKKMKSKILGI